MSYKPPKESPTPLSLENKGTEEYRAREAAIALEKASSAKNETLRRLANQELMAKAVREAAEDRTDWARIKWAALRFSLFMLVGYFLLSGFFDFVNFIEGVKILSVGLGQITVMAALYFISLKVRDNLPDDQAAVAKQKFKYFGKLAWVGAMIYASFSGLRGFSGILVHKGKHGLRWNYPFLYFLCFLAVVLAISYWLALQRKKAQQVLHEIEYGQELPNVSPDQLYLIKYLCEGMMLNLGLMALFQFTYGVDVPMGLYRALSSPGVFLFFFFPFFTYVFLRKFFGSF